MDAVARVTGETAICSQVTMEKYRDQFPESLRDEMKGNIELLENEGYFGCEAERWLNNSHEYVQQTGLRRPFSLDDWLAQQFRSTPE